MTTVSPRPRPWLPRSPLPPSRVAPALALLFAGALAACAPDAPAPGAGAPETSMTPPPFAATNVIYSYQDLDRAWGFYTRVLGLETVADHGSVKVLRVAAASYLTLVDASVAPHPPDAPKTATLALVTEEVEGWWTYLAARGVPMRHQLSEVDPARAHNGFVAVDPEGYLLEFERFNPHEENTELLPRLAAWEALGPTPEVHTTRPAELRIQATVLWLYYHDIEGALAWYEDALDTRLLVDQGWAKVVPASATGYLGFVEGTRGLHQATEEKAVTVSFITHDVEIWLARMRARPDFPLRTPEMAGEVGRSRSFAGYDPEGYLLEWSTILPSEENRAFVTQLGGLAPG